VCSRVVQEKLTAAQRVASASIWKRRLLNAFTTAEPSSHYRGRIFQCTSWHSGFLRYSSRLPLTLAFVVFSSVLRPKFHKNFWSFLRITHASLVFFSIFKCIIFDEKANYKSYGLVLFNALASPGFWSRYSPKNPFSQTPRLWGKNISIFPYTS
jgi:hypothetical protein